MQRRTFAYMNGERRISRMEGLAPGSLCRRSTTSESSSLEYEALQEK